MYDTFVALVLALGDPVTNVLALDTSWPIRAGKPALQHQNYELRADKTKKIYLSSNFNKNVFETSDLRPKALLKTSLAGPHHVDAEPDSAFYADPDPVFPFDADPDPTTNFFQIQHPKMIRIRNST